MMTNLEILANTMRKVNEINAQPAKTENEVQKLRREVKLLHKIIIAIFKTLTPDQQKEALAHINDTGKDK